MSSPAQGLLRGLRTASPGVAGYVLALAAHVAAGSAAPGPIVLFLLAGLISAVSVLLTGVRLSPVRVVLCLTAMQVVLHEAFMRLSGPAGCGMPAMSAMSAQGFQFMTVISDSPFTRAAPVASSRVARPAAVGALVGAVVIGTAISASAHVGVHPDVTTSGQGAELTFRVPDESDTANTIRLVVTPPQGRPFTDVSTQPMPGWTATVTDAPLPKPVNVGGATVTKAPHTVTWSALPGNKIAPGEYQDFYLATDSLPAAGEMVLPVAQYYSDDKVVHRTEPTLAGKPQPEHPAPVFTVTAASATGASATPAASIQASGLNAPAATTWDNTVWTWDNTVCVLGGVALVVALVAGGLVLLWRRPQTDVK